MAPTASDTLWMKQKNRLARDKRYSSWLSSFAIDNPVVDAITYDTTKKLVDSDLDYDPYQIEALLSSATTRLDRCLVYRREMNDLEEQAVRRALEYDLFDKQYDLQLRLELAEHIKKQREAEKTGQSEATEAFSKSADPLELGFAAASRASAKSSQHAIDGETTRRQDVEKKWEALKDYQLALQSRHETPGHALNYQDRFNTIKGHFESDLKVAYKKARCISLGAGRIYGIVDPLKPPTETGYLDYLVNYVRSTLEQIELESLKEVEFEHVVSISQLRLLRPDASLSFRHLGDAEWNTALAVATGDGRLVIDLAKEFPSTFKRLRVRGIAASYLTSNINNREFTLRTTSVVVFPPPPANWHGGGTLPPRTPIVLERVGPSDQRPPPEPHASINNLDPRGVWQIQVSTNLLSVAKDKPPLGRSPGDIWDIKLHLKLVATLENNPDFPTWRQYWW